MFFKKPTITKYWNPKEEKYEFKIAMNVGAIPSMKKAEEIADSVLDIVTEAEGQTVLSK